VPKYIKKFTDFNIKFQKNSKVNPSRSPFRVELHVPHCEISDFASHCQVINNEAMF